MPTARSLRHLPLRGKAGMGSDLHLTPQAATTAIDSGPSVKSSDYFSLRYMHVFVRLNGDIPLRMRLGVLDHRGHHPFGDAPFGLQVEHALRPHPCGVPLGPFEVAFAFDDHLQLVRPLQRFVQRGLLPFGRQTYPVEVTACTRRGCRFFWRPPERTLSAVTSTGYVLSLIHI